MQTAPGTAERSGDTIDDMIIYIGIFQLWSAQVDRAVRSKGKASSPPLRSAMGRGLLGAATGGLPWTKWLTWPSFGSWACGWISIKNS
jgi:hypothetical protein